MKDWVSDLAQCADEVKYYVHDFVASRIVPAIDGGILKSDSIIDQSLQDELRIAACALRKDLAKRNEQSGPVRDIVDPSLFPFVFEKTKVLRNGPTALSDCIFRCGEGQAVRSPPEADACQSDPIKYPNDKAWSRRFQWLPFEVKLEHNGQGAPRYVSLHSLELS